MSNKRKILACPPKCITRRRILVAGMGTSPAVLTNAVWAHQKNPLFFTGVDDKG
jgi:hypothetical protein